MTRLSTSTASLLFRPTATCWSWPERGIGFFDAHTLRPLHVIDTLAALNPSFSPSGDRLYVSVRTGDSWDTLMATVRLDVPGYPVETRNLRQLIPDLCQVRHFRLSSDADHAYLYFTWDATIRRYFFAAIDLEADSVLHRQILRDIAAAGGLDMTPDESRVFAAHPGNTTFTPR